MNPLPLSMQLMNVSLENQDYKNKFTFMVYMRLQSLNKYKILGGVYFDRVSLLKYAALR